MHAHIELARDDNGRSIAEVLELQGVMSCGLTRDEAIRNAEQLALEVIADPIAHREMPPAALAISSSLRDPQ